ncbi:hypothetical protein [Psychrobacter sp. UBA2769]|uniref:hypothetical protein n=1 Tax=Psychrobacter sp. UBA2769 TaxID=1947348 RepID=UPI0025EF0F2C|nr:hypothetical protein [Psychrobacter sp. UBA2769]
MSFIIASLEGDYDKYIALSEVLEVICCLSKNTVFYATNYLEHHNFIEQVQAYYIDTGCGEISLIDNAKEVMTELFQDIRDIAPCSTITRDLPRELGCSLSDIYFIDDELNKLELLQKFGAHEFTNELDVNSSIYKLYQAEKDVVIEMLNDFVSSQLNINNELLPINQVPELIARFFHHFIIWNDELRLISTDELVESKSQLIAKTINSKLHLVKKDAVQVDEQSRQQVTASTKGDESQAKIAELEKQLKQAHADNDLLRKKLDSNKELQPNSQAAVARLLNVLFYKADYDITAHQGTTNTKIQKLSKEMGMPVGEKFISKWIKIVNNEKIVDEQ